MPTRKRRSSSACSTKSDATIEGSSLPAAGSFNGGPNVRQGRAGGGWAAPWSGPYLAAAQAIDTVNRNIAAAAGASPTRNQSDRGPDPHGTRSGRLSFGGFRTDRLGGVDAERRDA